VVVVVVVVVSWERMGTERAAHSSNGCGVRSTALRSMVTITLPSVVPRKTQIRKQWTHIITHSVQGKNAETK